MVSIGDNTTITHATILCHDASTKRALGKAVVGKVKIGSNCFIGWGSVILKGVTIGDNCIIGAGSIVTRDIPDNSVAAGNPCKVICSFDDYINKHKEAMKTHPVYETYHANKSAEEIVKMQAELENTWGYDV